MSKQEIRHEAQDEIMRAIEAALLQREEARVPHDESASDRARREAVTAAMQRQGARIGKMYGFTSWHGVF